MTTVVNIEMDNVPTNDVLDTIIEEDENEKESLNKEIEPQLPINSEHEESQKSVISKRFMEIVKKTRMLVYITMTVIMVVATIYGIIINMIKNEGISQQQIQDSFKAIDSIVRYQALAESKPEENLDGYEQTTQ